MQNKEKLKANMKKNYEKNKEERKSFAKKHRQKIKEDIQLNGLILPTITEKTCIRCKTTKPINQYSITLNMFLSTCKTCRNKEAKVYRLQNKDKIRMYFKTYTRTVKSKVFTNLRKRLVNTVNSIDGSKTEATVKLLGCSKKFLKDWIMFNCNIDGYVFEDYGKVWNLDHVVPCNAFDFENDLDVQCCFNWTNVRPLDKQKNSSKQDYIIWGELFIHEIRLKRFIKINHLKEDTISIWNCRALTTAASGKTRSVASSVIA
jgi:hypothetical protein